MNEYLDETRKRRGKRDEQRIDGVLNTALSPLLRQIRKFTALKACLAALPEELSGLAAPFDIRQAPRRGGVGISGAAQAGDSMAKAEAPTVSTIYLYVAGSTVEAVLEQRAAMLVEQINAQLPYPLVEELRCELASPAKIEKQLNILAARPD